MIDPTVHSASVAIQQLYHVQAHTKSLAAKLIVATEGRLHFCHFEFFQVQAEQAWQLIQGMSPLTGVIALLGAHLMKKQCMWETFLELSVWSERLSSLVTTA